MNTHVPFASPSAWQVRAAAKTPVTIAHGDGIGPEIMAASLDVLIAAGARLDIQPVDVGLREYERGNTSGVSPEAWDSLLRTRVLYKGPIGTPQGGGMKSVNVTLRKTLGLFANIRPCAAFAPFVASKHPEMDLVIVRENEEDLYAGIEHRQTQDVVQCLKIVSRQGCERIVRYAFEYAVANGRRKVTCMTKDNIMKMTDGLFHSVFDEIAREYPQIETDHLIIDIGAARLAASPGQFDVVVTMNLYGDIVSDVVAEIAGSVGLAGSANVGERCAMFEAIHGSAPTIAGQDIANPSGCLMAGVMMLVHIGQQDVAERVHNAWLRTIEEGVHTADIFSQGQSVQKVGTREFAQAVIDRLGLEPQILRPARYNGAGALRIAPVSPRREAVRTLEGVDVFAQWTGPAGELASAMSGAPGPFELAMISNRGVKVWPEGNADTNVCDHWRCRFIARPGAQPAHADIARLQMELAERGVDFIKTEHLYAFDGKAGYSQLQGA